jgi:hypothetical protein
MMMRIFHEHASRVLTWKMNYIYIMGDQFVKKIDFL